MAGAAAAAISAPPPVAPRAAAKSARRPASDSTVAAVDREVSGSLDDLKEKIFRLELRHQAGTISDEEYTRQRAQVEQTLRNLVRG